MNIFFEHFLITALKNNYDCGESEAAKLVKSIPIIHLHGNLGDLPFHGSKNERPYRSNVNLDNIKLATGNIKIVSEAVEDDPEFQQARNVLSKAKRVIFLGFGYHDDNVFRLKLRETCQVDVSIYGHVSVSLNSKERPFLAGISTIWILHLVPLPKT